MTQSEHEWIRYRGLLGADGRFSPLGCLSGRQVRRAKAAASEQHSSVRLEVHDREGRVLARPALRVEERTACHVLEVDARFIEGRFALPDGAAEILLFEDDILRDRRPVGKPPKINMRLVSREISRSRPLSVALSLSDPEPESLLYVAYQWDAHLYQNLGISDPTDRLQINLEKLPGGPECRLHIAFASGLRTTRATSDTFALPPLAPALRINSPQEGRTFTPWDPIELEGSVVDHQRAGDIVEGDLEWMLDGELIARGRLGFLSALSEGEHELALNYGGPKGSRITRRIEVAPPSHTAHQLREMSDDP